MALSRNAGCRAATCGSVRGRSGGRACRRAAGVVGGRAAGRAGGRVFFPPMKTQQQRAP